jgi:hypothetical protein
MPKAQMITPTMIAVLDGEVHQFLERRSKKENRSKLDSDIKAKMAMMSIMDFRVGKAGKATVDTRGIPKSSARVTAFSAVTSLIALGPKASGASQSQVLTNKVLLR